jgi:hypothetical protein
LGKSTYESSRVRYKCHYILKKVNRTNWGKVPTTLSWARHIYYDPPNIGYMNKITVTLAIMSAIIATGLAISTYATPAFAAISSSSSAGDDEADGAASISRGNTDTATSSAAAGDDEAECFTFLGEVVCFGN